MDRWTEKDPFLILKMIEIYREPRKVLPFKEELWNIFDLSETKTEAITKEVL